MPDLIIIGGPNGAGKTTVAFKVLPAIFKNSQFVNADIIAAGLSAFNPASVDIEAGRLMLQRLNELKNSGKDFSFETTLSSKSLFPFIKKCKSSGYKLIFFYVWVREAKLAIERIYKRSDEGGHFIPEDVVRRRYERSKNNLVNLYLPLADEWVIFDNSENSPEIIAEKKMNSVEEIYDKLCFEKLMKSIVKESGLEYQTNEIFKLVKAAIREELDRKYKLNLPIVFMHKGEIVEIEGKDLYEFLKKNKLT